MKKNFFDYITIIIACLIIFSGSSVFSKYKYILIAIYAFLIFIKGIHKSKINCCLKPIYNKIIILLCIFLIATIPFSFSINNTLEFLVFFILMFISSIIGNNDIKFYDLIRKWILYFSLILAGSIFITIINKNFLLDNFEFLLPATSGSLAAYKSELINGNYSGIAFERAYAAFCLSCGISAIYAEIIYNNKIKKKNILVLVLLFVALFCTGKRMLLLINIFNFIFLFFLNKRNVKTSKFFKIFFICVTLLTIAIFKVPEANRVFERLFGDTNKVSTITLRQENYWNYCIKMFNDKPIIGYGINTFTTYLTKKTSVVEIYNAHNIYYQLLGETGIIGFILFIIIFASIFLISLKLLKIYINDKKALLNINFIILLQSLFLIYGISGNSFYYLSQLFVYFLCISILSYYYINVNKKRNDNDEKN